MEPLRSGSAGGHRLSIAMCTYNGATHVRAQLDSFAGQTRLPDELVVCDDCSSDDTTRIVGEFAARARFEVRLFVNPTNLGFVKNFEKAVGLCRGDVIFLSDQDDVWRAEKLERFMAGVAANPAAGLFFCDADLVDDDLRPLGKTWWGAQGFGKAAQRRLESETGFRVMLKDPAWMAAGATLAFAARHAASMFPIPPGWTHDAWISTLVSATARVKLIPMPLNEYRQHASQVYGAPTDVAQQIRHGLNRGDSARHFTDTAQRYEELERRLKQHAPAASPVFAMVERKIRHWRLRAGIRSVSRVRGAGIAFSELLAGNYHRFSKSWRSFAMDFVFVLGVRARKRGS
jgi:glycosyltransferase involved in cell wall biosynthesis